MSNSKAERRKCGLWLHGWPGVLFNHCVLYGITLVKVLSTRIVSISSTLSLILEPNPSMSENMCGLAVCSELDGISHQCVTKSSGRLVPPGFLRCNLQSQVCFWHASSVWFPPWSPIETWNWNQLRAHAAAPISSLISLMIVHIWNNLRTVCSLGAWQRRFVPTATSPSATALPPRYTDLIKNVLTTPQRNESFLHIDTITAPLWRARVAPACSGSGSGSFLMMIFFSDSCHATP